MRTLSTEDRLEDGPMGTVAIPAGAYYGSETARAILNFQISDIRIHQFPAFIQALTHATIGKLEPDLTFILDVPVAVGLQRAIKRRGRATADRFEGESLAFHESLREAYRRIAADNPARCVVIDANAEPVKVAERIREALQSRLPAPSSVGAGA